MEEGMDQDAVVAVHSGVPDTGVMIRAPRGYADIYAAIFRLLLGSYPPRLMCSMAARMRRCHFSISIARQVSKEWAAAGKPVLDRILLLRRRVWRKAHFMCRLNAMRR